MGSASMLDDCGDEIEGGCLGTYSMHSLRLIRGSKGLRHKISDLNARFRNSQAIARSVRFSLTLEASYREKQTKSDSK